jgi:phosphate transport system permease protein
MTAPALPAKREISTKPRPSDRIFRGVVTSFGLLNLLILTLIGAFLLFRGFEVLRTQGISFLTDQKWNIDSETGKPSGSFGIGAMLSGTVIASLVALAVALPISVLTALMLNFYIPTRLRVYLVTLIDLMAAFPSILFGLWGYFILMPSAEYWAKLLHKYFGWFPLFDVPQPFFTRSPFVAGLVLAIMIIPIITSVSREVFSQAPLDRIQAAYALGANKWAMIKAVVLPFGANGAVGGAMLGLGRAFGETVAVYTVLNIVYKVNWHILFGAGGNVASHIVLRWGEAGPYEVKALLAAGFVLFLLTLAVNFIADAVIKRTVKKGR